MSPLPGTVSLSPEAEHARSCMPTQPSPTGLRPRPKRRAGGGERTSRCHLPTLVIAGAAKRRAPRELPPPRMAAPGMRLTRPASLLPGSRTTSLPAGRAIDPGPDLAQRNSDPGPPTRYETMSSPPGCSGSETRSNPNRGGHQSRSRRPPWLRDTLPSSSSLSVKPGNSAAERARNRKRHHPNRLLMRQGHGDDLHEHWSDSSSSSLPSWSGLVKP